MEDKAKQRALEAYPKDIEEWIGVNGVKSVVDNNSWQRTLFLKGYHQAEKDMELTVDDIKNIDRLLNQCVDCNNPYQEVLKRFNKERKENEIRK